MCAGTAVTTGGVRLSKLNKAVTGPAALGVPENAGSLYELALTHRSHAFEQPEPGGHNERLEFLGDAILGAVVTAFIYERYPDLTEGEMARLRASVVNTEALADAARDLGLGEHMLLGKGEEASGGRDKASLLANSFEALVGAVYLDRGLPAVEESLRHLFEDRLEESMGSGRYDSKTALQELAVRVTGDLPVYRIASSGPDHEKRFDAHVFLSGAAYGSGSGRSKKEAEQNAARQALAKLEEEGSDARAS